MYSPAEERFNITSHAFGLALSVVALALLVVRANNYGTFWHVFSFAVFGSSLVILYSTSTWYHNTANPELRRRLRVADHASIYILIAGTCTPFALVTLDGTLGTVVFAISWGLAICGISLKLFFTGRYKLLSTLMYVGMGWMMVFAIEPMTENISADGITWLAIGGISYTTGAVLYAFKNIKFNHAIFHVFVLIGSFSHFVSVYFYVLPAP